VGHSTVFYTKINSLLLFNLARLHCQVRLDMLLIYKKSTAMHISLAAAAEINQRYLKLFHWAQWIGRNG